LLLLRANSPIVINVADTCTARVPTRLGLVTITRRRRRGGLFYNAPTKVTGLTGVTQVAAGGDNSLALHGDGTVSSFGRNRYGE